jgi:hypothetical protein
MSYGQLDIIARELLEAEKTSKLNLSLAELPMMPTQSSLLILKSIKIMLLQLQMMDACINGDLMHSVDAESEIEIRTCSLNNSGSQRRLNISMNIL